MTLRLLALSCCLLAALVLPAGASAATTRHHHHHGGGGWDEEQVSPDGSAGDPYDDGGTEEGAVPVPLPAQPAAPVAPVAPVVPVTPAKPVKPSVPAEPVEPEYPELPTVPASTGTVKGTTAMLRTDGKAAIPRGAPKRVREIIAAANQIVGKPYKWGGGHAKLVDSGYDCSGAVSYSLIGARILYGPMVSGTLAHWAAHGDGRWMTVYANKGHVYMEVAGLRLDTSPVGDPAGRDGVRWRPLIGRRTGFHARHVLGL